MLRGEQRGGLVLRLAEMVVFADYACVGAMRSTLPYHVRALGNGAAASVGMLESIYGVGLLGGSLLGGSLALKPLQARSLRRASDGASSSTRPAVQLGALPNRRGSESTTAAGSAQTIATRCAWRHE